jgi:ribonuclease Z
VFAFVMDTAWCDAAVELAAGADLLVCESTFLESDAELAARYGHLTARQAGRVASEAGARRLVLTHFSARYTDMQHFVDEAAREFQGDIVVADDLMRVAITR